jgi:hypothetical protein
MNKKTISLVAMIVSAVVFFFGFLVMVGAIGGDTGLASGAPYSYDSGYAEFGADFYTYVSNNAGEAATAARKVASNLDEIATLLKGALGIFLMGCGAMNLCRFALVWVDEKNAAAAAPAVEEVSAMEEVPVVEETEQAE